MTTKPNLQIQRMCSYTDTNLIENTQPSEFDCTWCEAKVGETHSRACPNGEKYKQVQQLTKSITARELGRRGGKAKSEVKSTAARENGKKGGRPSKQLDVNDI